MSPTHGGPLWCKLTLKVRHARCQVTCINCREHSQITQNVFACYARGEVG